MRRYEIREVTSLVKPFDGPIKQVLIDERDIEPLIRAANKAEAALNGYGCTPIANEVRAALQPFEEGRDA